MRPRTSAGKILVLLLLLAPALAFADAGPDREHRVKAVFLFNFAQFVDWPDSALGAPKEPLVVGILGGDPFESFLDEVVKGESVHDRPVVIKRFKRTEDIKACHVLFVSSGEESRLDGILASLKGRNILTVGESVDFNQRGGMVCFATESGKVRLKINLEAVQAAHLAVSSKLLRLADTSSPGAK